MIRFLPRKRILPYEKTLAMQQDNLLHQKKLRDHFVATDRIDIESHRFEVAADRVFLLVDL